MSTRNTIICTEDIEQNELLAYVHVFTECFDNEDRVFIETWEQGEEENTFQMIDIRRDVWDALVAEIVKQQAALQVGQALIDERNILAEGER